VSGPSRPASSSSLLRRIEKIKLLNGASSQPPCHRVSRFYFTWQFVCRVLQEFPAEYARHRNGNGFRHLFILHVWQVRPCFSGECRTFRHTCAISALSPPRDLRLKKSCIDMVGLLSGCKESGSPESDENLPPRAPSLQRLQRVSTKASFPSLRISAPSAVTKNDRSSVSRSLRR